MKPYRALLLVAILSVYPDAFSQPGKFESRGIGGGGALFSPMINPQSSSEIFMACDMSEIYHSNNAGQNWEILHFKSIQGGHDSRMQFTKNSNTRYCIDYTSVNGTDYTRPVKSTDGGKTWKTMPGNPYPTEVAYHLSADYDNPDRLILGFYGEIWFSADGGTTFKKVYTCKSTAEGNHIAGVFFDGNTIWVGLNDGLLRSQDGGSTFSLMTTSGLPAGEKILSFSAAKAGTTLRFCCLTMKSVWAGIQHGFEYAAWDNVNNKSVAAMQGVYTMDQGNGTWKAAMTGIDRNLDFPVFTGMAENDISTIYLSGGSSTGAPIVMKSTDGGSTWNHVFRSAGNKNIRTGWSGDQGDRLWSYGECPFGFNVMKTDARKVIFTDFGFAHMSTDGGGLWEQLYVNPGSENPENQVTPKMKYYQGNGLENTTNWNILWTDSTHLFASFSDINGVMSQDKGKTWKFIPNLTQNSVYHIVRGSGGALYAATSSVHDMYQSTRLTDNLIDAGKGAIYFSTDQGGTFKLLHDFQHPVIWLAMDPGNPKRMYASVIHSTAGGIYMTENLDQGSASVWTKCNAPIGTQGHPFVIRVLKNGHLVVSYSGRRAGSPQQFTASSGVFYSTDKGTKWSDRSHTSMRYWTKDIVIDPSDTSESTWYAAVFSGWGSAVPAGTGGLYRTQDKGLTWQKISDPGASYRVNSCTVNPAKPEEMYYTTETDGLWFTGNKSAVTPAFTLVNSYPFRHPVRVQFNPYRNSEVWVSGFGSGMMVGSSGSSGAFVPKQVEKPVMLKISPNPSTGRFVIRHAPVSGRLTAEVYDNHGMLVLFQNGYGEETSELDLSGLPPGVYTVYLRSSGFQGMGRLLLFP